MFFIVLRRRICAISANQSSLWLRPAKRLRYDFKSGEILKVVPKAEYEVLFGLAGLP